MKNCSVLVIEDFYFSDERSGKMIEKEGSYVFKKLQFDLLHLHHWQLFLDIYDCASQWNLKAGENWLHIYNL